MSDSDTSEVTNETDDRKLTRSESKELLMNLCNNPCSYDQKNTPQCWVYSSLHFLLNFIEINFGLSLHFEKTLDRFKEKTSLKKQLNELGGNFVVFIKDYINRCIKLLGQDGKTYRITSCKVTVIRQNEIKDNFGYISSRLGNGYYFYIGVKITDKEGHAMCVTSHTENHFICSNSWFSKPIMRVSKFQTDYHLISISELDLREVIEDHPDKPLIKVVIPEILEYLGKRQVLPSASVLSVETSLSHNVNVDIMNIDVINEEVVRVSDDLNINLIKIED